VRGHTASAGVAELDPGQSTEGVLAAAGSALEQARAAGGGQAQLCSAPSDDGEQVSSAQGEVIAALASTLGERDRYTGDHSESVVDLATRIGSALALDAEQISRLRTAALLHDIGKVGVPDSVLRKPGRLDHDEFELIRRHPELGAQILEHPSLADVREWVRSHHERPDGRGYPLGCSGEQIALEARIVAVADAYEAMTSDRAYRPAMSHMAAREELERCAGSQFDERVVHALIALLDRESQRAETTLERV
jgi:HD-GYP domain-containing protein (c-di-GMP phosphodiesterase class II)